MSGLIKVGLIGNGIQSKRIQKKNKENINFHYHFVKNNIPDAIVISTMSSKLPSDDVIIGS